MSQELQRTTHKDRSINRYSDEVRYRLAMMLVKCQSEQLGDSEAEIYSEALSKLPELAVELHLSVAEVADLLNDPVQLKLVRGLTKARAELIVNSIGIDRLSQMVAAGSNKDAVAALKLLGIFTGVFKQTGTAVQVNLSFDERHKLAREKKEHPLSDLFEIRNVTPKHTEE